MAARRVLPLAEAAKVLGTSVPTLHRWIASGAPVARAGRRGRGHAALVDPDAVAAWRRAQAAHDGATAALVAHGTRAETVSDAVAERLFELWQRRELEVFGVPRHQTAKLAGFVWHQVAVALHAHLGLDPVDVVPPKIAQLREF